MYSTLSGALVLLLPLYRETRDLVVNRFGTGAVDSEVGYTICELVFNSRLVLYVVVVLG